MSFVEIAGCNINVSDQLVDIFGDDLKLDGHIGKTLAICCVLLDGQIIYCPKLEILNQTQAFWAGLLEVVLPEQTWIAETS